MFVVYIILLDRYKKVMTEMLDPCITVDNVTVSYHRHPVVHHVSVDFPCGYTNAIIGPNGAGKSTLLKVMMGMLAPDEGKVTFHHDETVSYLPQQSDIDRSLPITVEDLVATGFLAHGSLFAKITKAAMEKVAEALSIVGLTGFENRTINNLSNGQFQRALFARIIVQDADVILLDEPFNAVDAKTNLDLCSVINNWRKQGKTVIAVIHDFHVAKAHFDYTLMMACEKVAFGATKAVLTEQNFEKAYSASLYWDDHADVCSTPQSGES